MALTAANPDADAPETGFEPETRVWASDLLSWPCHQPSAPIGPYPHWAFAHSYDGLTAGTSQFISRDPAVSVTMSPYAYAGGDPLNVTDPSGLWGLPDFGGIARTVANTTRNVATSATTWVDNHAGAISAAAGTVATVTAFVPGLQGVAVVAGAISVGTGAIQTGLDLRRGAGIGTIALDAAALIPGVTAEAAAVRALTLARELRAASDAAAFYSSFGSDAARLLDIQSAAAMVNNDLRITNGWGSVLGFGSTAFGWGGVLDAQLCRG